MSVLIQAADPVTDLMGDEDPPFLRALSIANALPRTNRGGAAHDNRAGFSGPSTDKRGGAFPQVRWVVAAE